MSQPGVPRRGRPKSIGHYILGKTIGEGTFGKVKLGTHILTGEKVAVKILEKERIVDVADVERVAREVYILKLIRHPNVVQLYEIIETSRQLYLIMEYASGGELFDYIVASGRLEEPEACRFFQQILEGVGEIHRMNVVHRDLKPENLLIDEHKSIKIVDFGLSNTYRDGQLLKTACGSPCYAAPEMIAGKQYVPSLCDIWSCGVILFAMLCGYLPFEDQNTAALYKKILAAEYQCPDFLSAGARDLIAGMLTTEPTKRLNASKIRSHVWYIQIPAMPTRSTSADMQVLEEDILEELDKFGFPRDYAVKCLQMNKHNHVTTTYHLLAEKKRRMMDRITAAAQQQPDGFAQSSQGQGYGQPDSARSYQYGEVDQRQDVGSAQVDDVRTLSMNNSGRGGHPINQGQPVGNVSPVTVSRNMQPSALPTVAHHGVPTAIPGWAAPGTTVTTSVIPAGPRQAYTPPSSTRVTAGDVRRSMEQQTAQAYTPPNSARMTSGHATPPQSLTPQTLTPPHTPHTPSPYGQQPVTTRTDRAVDMSPVSATRNSAGAATQVSPQTGSTTPQAVAAARPYSRPEARPVAQSVSPGPYPQAMTPPQQVQERARPGESSTGPQASASASTSSRSASARQTYGGVPRRGVATPSPVPTTQRPSPEPRAPSEARSTSTARQAPKTSTGSVSANSAVTSVRRRPYAPADQQTQTPPNSARARPEMRLGPATAWDGAGRTSAGGPDPSRPATARGTPSPELLEPSSAAAAAAGPLSTREEAASRRAAYDVSRTSSKPQRQIVQEIHRALAAQHVAFRQVSPLSVRCQRHAVRFNVEVACLDRLGSIHAVRFQRVAGELWQYKDICAKLLAEMRV